MSEISLAQKAYSLAAQAKTLGDELATVSLGLNRQIYDRMSLAQLLVTLRYVRDTLQRKARCSRKIYRYENMARAIRDMDACLARLDLESDLSSLREAQYDDLTPLVDDDSGSDRSSP